MQLANNTKKRQTDIDPIVEAKKGKYFKKYSKEADEKIKLEIKNYNQRKKLS